jgi:cytochrome bd-type quinol oxidase subunit 2
MHSSLRVGLTLLALLTVTVCAYLIAWHGKHSTVRRAASFIFAVISALVGFVGTFGYAIPALDDFHNRAVPFAGAVIGNIVIWAICTSAWIIAFRCVLFALRKDRSSQSSSEKSL